MEPFAFWCPAPSQNTFISPVTLEKTVSNDLNVRTQGPKVFSKMASVLQGDGTRPSDMDSIASPRYTSY